MHGVYSVVGAMFAEACLALWLAKAEGRAVSDEFVSVGVWQRGGEEARPGLWRICVGVLQFDAVAEPERLRLAGGFAVCMWGAAPGPAVPGACAPMLWRECRCRVGLVWPRARRAHGVPQRVDAWCVRVGVCVCAV